MSLTFKLEPIIDRITVPVVIEYEGTTEEFSDGKAACDHVFSKCLQVDEIKAIESKIVLVLKENKEQLNCNWCGDEQPSFF